MALPDLIEIEPPRGMVRADLTVPGSKSITNRALILAALADGKTVLEEALWSQDTQVLTACLGQLGFKVTITSHSPESSNRTLTVFGQGGKVPPGGSAARPRELFVGNSGTTARFLAALVCLGRGVYRLHGLPRMHERPQAGLFAALRQLGYRVDTPNERLPALIHGAGPRAAWCRVTTNESSQFASAVLLGARAGGWNCTVADTDGERSPYISLSISMSRAFPHGGGRFRVEPDASSGSYLLGAAHLIASRHDRPGLAAWAFSPLEKQGRHHAVSKPHPAAGVRVVNWPGSGWQIDEAFPRYLDFPGIISRKTDLGDSILTAMVLAPACAPRPVTFVDLGHLQGQESERLTALCAELTQCGAQVEATGNTLRICPGAGRLRGATIETYRDHRIAMCFSILGLKVPGMRIKNPACVGKTFPSFYQKLAAPPPTGLGVAIREGRTGRRLEAEDLLAE